MKHQQRISRTGWLTSGALLFVCGGLAVSCDRETPVEKPRQAANDPPSSPPPVELQPLSPQQPAAAEPDASAPKAIQAVSQSLDLRLMRPQDSLPLIRLKKMAGNETALICVGEVKSNDVQNVLYGPLIDRSSTATAASLRETDASSTFWRYSRTDGSLVRIEKDAWLADETSVWTMVDDAIREGPDRYRYRLASGHFRTYRASPEHVLTDHGLHGYRLQTTGEHGLIAVTSTLGRTTREGHWPNVGETVMGPFLLDIFDRDTGKLQCGPIQLQQTDTATYLTMSWSEDQELVVLVTGTDELVLHIADRNVLCKGE